jgi:predicted amidohydrolase
MQNLTVSLIQDSLHWQDPAANREKFGAIIGSVSESDLILLPEMFTTGFAQESAKLAESMQGETVRWMLSLAQQHHVHIAGSLVIKEDEQVFNRLVWAKLDGTYQVYNKRHLFSFAGEDKVYQAGSERIIIDCNGWRVCPQVCYDLRFPVWSRNRNDYDVLIYVANWPKVRVSHWSQLLVARAIENLAYVVGVNRIGEDGNGFAHNGQSIALDPKGKPLVEPGSKAGCYTVTLDYEELLRYRKKFGALEDGDEFEIV